MTRRHNTVSSPHRGQARVLSIPRAETPAPPPHDASPTEKAAAAGWVKGQLLNVRNTGNGYNVTLEGEEYDPCHPERCLQFANSAECQNFVSEWYAPTTGGAPPWV